jgi:ubiquitin conjugation factor E4 B
MNSPIRACGKEQRSNPLDGPEIDRLISDLQARFPDERDGLVDIFGPLIRRLLLHSSLVRPEGLLAADASWRAVLDGLKFMTKHRSICNMITRQREWCPKGEDAVDFEKTSLLGPLLRLGVFGREWVNPLLYDRLACKNCPSAQYCEVIFL